MALPHEGEGLEEWHVPRVGDVPECVSESRWAGLPHETKAALWARVCELYPTRYYLRARAHTDLPAYRFAEDEVMVEALDTLDDPRRSPIPGGHPAIGVEFIPSNTSLVEVFDPDTRRHMAAWERQHLVDHQVFVAYGLFEADYLPKEVLADTFPSPPSWWDRLEPVPDLVVTLPAVFAHRSQTLQLRPQTDPFWAVAATTYSGAVLSAVLSAVHYKGRLYTVPSPHRRGWAKIQPHHYVDDPATRTLCAAVVDLTLSLDWERVHTHWARVARDAPQDPFRRWVTVTREVSAAGDLAVTEWLGFESPWYAEGVKRPTPPPTPVVPPPALAPAAAAGAPCSPPQPSGGRSTGRPPRGGRPMRIVPIYGRGGDAPPVEGVPPPEMPPPSWGTGPYPTSWSAVDPAVTAAIARSLGRMPTHDGGAQRGGVPGAGARLCGAGQRRVPPSHPRLPGGSGRAPRAGPPAGVGGPARGRDRLDDERDDGLAAVADAAVRPTSRWGGGSQPATPAASLTHKGGRGAVSSPSGHRGTARDASAAIGRRWLTLPARLGGVPIVGARLRCISSRRGLSMEARIP